MKCTLGLFLAVALIWGALSYKPQSTKGRLFIAQRTFQLIQRHPLSGYGPGGFLKEYMDCQGRFFAQHPYHEAAMLADEVQHPLCEFLYAWTELGLLGPLALVSLFAWIFLQSSASRWILLPLFVFCCFSYPLLYPIGWLPFFAGLAEFSAKKWHFWLLKAGAGLFLLAVFMKLCMDLGFIASPFHSYNRASRAYRKGQFAEAEIAARQCSQCCSSYNLELLSGDIEHHLGNDSAAVQHYISASHMCPVRFAPLEGLYAAYSAMGDTAMAKSVAKAIAEKPIKIQSSEVYRIKNEILNK